MEHLICCTCILFLGYIIEIGLLGTPEFSVIPQKMLGDVNRSTFFN